MIDVNNIATNVEIITGSDDTDKIFIISKKAKAELLGILDKTEDEIEDKYVDLVVSIIEDMACFKMNTLDKQGITNEKFDVISIEYSNSSNYPTVLLNRIDKLYEKINNKSPNSSQYATISSPFLCK